MAKKVTSKNNNSVSIDNMNFVEIAKGARTTPESEAIKASLLAIPAGKAAKLSDLVAEVEKKFGVKHQVAYQKVNFALKRKWAMHLKKMLNTVDNQVYVLNFTPVVKKEEAPVTVTPEIEVVATEVISEQAAA